MLMLAWPSWSLTAFCVGAVLAEQRADGVAGIVHAAPFELSALECAMPRHEDVVFPQRITALVWEDQVVLAPVGTCLLTHPADPHPLLYHRRRHESRERQHTPRPLGLGGGDLPAPPARLDERT